MSESAGTFILVFPALVVFIIGFFMAWSRFDHKYIKTIVGVLVAVMATLIIFGQPLYAYYLLLFCDLCVFMGIAAVWCRTIFNFLFTNIKGKDAQDAVFNPYRQRDRNVQNSNNQPK